MPESLQSSHEQIAPVSYVRSPEIGKKTHNLNNPDSRDVKLRSRSNPSRGGGGYQIWSVRCVFTMWEEG